MEEPCPDGDADDLRWHRQRRVGGSDQRFTLGITKDFAHVRAIKGKARAKPLVELVGKEKGEGAKADILSGLRF